MTARALPRSGDLTIAQRIAILSLHGAYSAELAIASLMREAPPDQTAVTAEDFYTLTARRLLQTRQDDSGFMLTEDGERAAIAIIREVLAA